MTVDLNTDWDGQIRGNVLTYTEDEWRLICESLPKQPENLREFRRAMERAAPGIVGDHKRPTRTEMTKAWNQMAASAEKLRTAARKVVDTDWELPEIELFCHRWIAEAESRAKTYQPHGPAKRRDRDRSLNQFVQVLLRLWEGLGEPLSFSTIQNAGVKRSGGDPRDLPGGVLIRFLVAATAPAAARANRKPPTPDQLANWVREAREEARKPPEDWG
jgi:hypothetical protein